MMKQYSTREAAQKLGLPFRTMQRHIAGGKIPVPPVQSMGGVQFRVWTDADIENVRQLLPKIANGRKTRYSKLQEKQKTPARAPVPHKSRKPKKK